MTTLTYSLTRQQAADYLGVSTRTIDRYVVKGDLRYKKIANKVVLSQEDVERLHHDLELIQQATMTGMPTSVDSENATQSGLVTPKDAPGARSSVREFVDILQEKDKAIEEKNQVIFGLQHQLGQLETRLQHVIALPDHTAEKSSLEQTIRHLEAQKKTLESQMKSEKMQNLIYMLIMLIIGAVVLYFLW